MNEGGGALQAIQIGMNSRDIVGSLKLFTELGFQNGGGQMIWGSAVAIQGLPPTARGQMWWLVGRQEFVQLEVFQHSEPAQRPLPDDWRCSDLGWTRFGMAVSSLDAARAVLQNSGIAITGECVDVDGTKRLVFRDPFIGCFVEIIEDGDHVPGGRKPRHFDLDPAILYATSSVSDLSSARAFYADTLQMKIVDGVKVHGPEHEALWGLAGAKSESFVVDTGSFLLEVVQYLDPAGRPKPSDYRTTDQGMVNVALGARERSVAERAIERVRQTGCAMTPMTIFGDACGTYVLEFDRELEICGLPSSLDAVLGFAPSNPFFGQQL